MIKHWRISVAIFVGLLSVFSLYRYFSYQREFREAMLLQMEQEYNALKIDYDYYSCLDGARVVYEQLWQGHCKDKGLNGYCNLPAELQENIRSSYERNKDSCYQDQEDAKKI